ncbi:MAG: hypothetical protein HY680_11165, partial [Chloroflexi bacterium]|nr:hypothetical protein [Chloroflexota bacterium]
MLEVIAWLLALELVGLLAFPFLHAVAPWLPDRGYAFAKPVGLVLAFYPLWLLASTSFVPNSLAILGAVLLGLAASSAWLVWKRPRLLDFVRREWGLLLLSEAVFLGIFALWAVIIARDSAISHTEQPMDFAFLNSTVTSRHFPPNDPWLSGFKVSYYYFGYLIFGGLARLAGISTAVGYNLALASIAGLSAAAIFGVVHGLISMVGGRASGAMLGGLLGVVLLLGVSNLEGGLEILRAGGKAAPSFWEQVDVKGLDGPKQSSQWYPTEGGWWWWRASRVIDTRENGESRDYTITEFPFFSLHLGDLHPHVMSLPFVLAFLGLALGLLTAPGKGGLAWVRGHLGLLALMALLLGALGFINLWDLPVFGLLLVGVAGTKAYSQRGAGRQGGLALVGSALAVVVMAVALYLPFYVGFHSQARGIVPVGEYVSRPFHFLVVWGLFLFIVAGFLAWALASALVRRPWRFRLMGLAALLALLPWLVWSLVEGVILWDAGKGMEAARSRLEHVAPLAGLMAAAIYLALLLAKGVMARRAVPEKASAVPLGGPTVSAGQQADAPTDAPLPQGGSLPAERGMGPAAGQPDERYPVGDAGLARVFPFLLAALALLLLMGPELFRVVDLFGNRMNTMFKLSYQAWTILAVASGYAVHFLSSRIFVKGPVVRLLGYGWTLLLALGLVTSLYYPAAAAYTKALAPPGQATLDGLAYVFKSSPGEYEAIQWLKGSYKEGEVMVEAVGDD